MRFHQSRNAMGEMALVRELRVFVRGRALRDLLHLNDVEVENGFADFLVVLIHPRNDETVITELRNWEAAETENGAHSLLLRRAADVAVTDHRLLTVWSQDVNKNFAFKLLGFLVLKSERDNQRLHLNWNSRGTNFFDEFEHRQIACLLIDRRT